MVSRLTFVAVMVEKQTEAKHQALILGDTEYTFSFPVKESIDIFGMNIDNKLHFDKHVSSVCKKDQ